MKKIQFKLVILICSSNTVNAQQITNGDIHKISIVH